MLLLVVQYCLCALRALSVLHFLPALCTLPFLRIIRAVLQLNALPEAQVGLELSLVILMSGPSVTVLIQYPELVLVADLAIVVHALCTIPAMPRVATKALKLPHVNTLESLLTAFPMAQVGRRLFGTVWAHSCFRPKP